MSERFIKFIPGPEAEFLQSKPFANSLLQLIATRARREDGHPDGLNIGECWIGDYDAIGATRQNYRTALDWLIRLKHVEIVENRRCKKSTTGLTINGTCVKLLSSTIWDINIFVDNHQGNHQPTTNKKEEDNKKEKKKIKKEKNGVRFDRSVSDFVGITPEYKKLLIETFAGIDIDFELNRMKLHLLEPKHAHKAGTGGFISNWLKNAVEWRKPQNPVEPIPETQQDVPQYLADAIRRRNEKAKSQLQEAYV